MWVNRFLTYTCWVSLTALLCCGCHRSEDRDSTLVVGVMSGPETELLQTAQSVAKSCYGISIRIKSFDNFNMLNAALNDGMIDANVFQHEPYLQDQIQNKHYQIKAIAKTFVYPMGLYSKKIHTLKDLPVGSRVSIPNDPTNEGRALLLLAQSGLIQLKKPISIKATVEDVIFNPKQLQIIPMHAAQLPRSLADVEIGVINTNYAIPAGLQLSDALDHEKTDSLYANLIVARTQDAHRLILKKLIDSVHAPEVQKKAHELFGAHAVPAWNTQESVASCIMKSKDK